MEPILNPSQSASLGYSVSYLSYLLFSQTNFSSLFQDWLKKSIHKTACLKNEKKIFNLVSMMTKQEFIHEENQILKNEIKMDLGVIRRVANFYAISTLIIRNKYGKL